MVLVDKAYIISVVACSDVVKAWTFEVPRPKPTSLFIQPEQKLTL